jgi:hypothetical protein
MDFGSLTLEQISMVFNMFGLPGVIFIIWWVDQRRIVSIQEGSREQVNKILAQYKDDVKKVSDYYTRNVELVERYERLSDDLAGIIHLNTQVQTQLVEKIQNNMFCPLVRDNAKRS